MPRCQKEQGRTFKLLIASIQHWWVSRVRTVVKDVGGTEAEPNDPILCVGISEHLFDPWHPFPEQQGRLLNLIPLSVVHLDQPFRDEIAQGEIGILVQLGHLLAVKVVRRNDQVSCVRGCGYRETVSTA